MTRRIGRIAALWRYPVKGMRGESLTAATLDQYGLTGDRRYAFTSTAAPLGAPLLASRERTALLRYSATLHSPDALPVVTTPIGERFPVDSAALLAFLHEHLAATGATLALQHSVKPITDVRPVALHSLATLQTLSQELTEALDPQRFRSNIVLELDDSQPFAEDALAGHFLRLGLPPSSASASAFRAAASFRSTP